MTIKHKVLKHYDIVRNCFKSLVQICDVTQQNQMNVDIFFFATNSVLR